ncbi:unnamed protein product [Mytilus edulis]|uniref:Uncharacterized protein n=1 Tax=Mytilus edulis TaxID=6550 RepID=A0A8S3Q1G8_MYTED|nr:unnamed protein product [Mytilus edulis]
MYRKRTLERGVHWNIEYFHIEADNTLGELFVAKYKQAHLKCKSGELLELVSNDGKNLGTFKQRKKRGDDEHEEENIGFVYMTSVTNCIRYEAINEYEYESVKEGDMLTSFENEAAADGLINCTKTNGDPTKMPFKMVMKIDGEWYKYTTGKPATKKDKFDMSYGKGDVLEFVKVDSSDNRWWKMKKLINNKGVSMPRSHLKVTSANNITNFKVKLLNDKIFTGDKNLLGDPVVKLKDICDTRWLSHIHAVEEVKRCNPTLIASREREASERTNATSARLAQFEKSPFFFRAIAMLLDTLPHLNHLSKLFQNINIFQHGRHNLQLR